MGFMDTLTTSVILLVENDPNDVFLTKRAFEKTGLGAAFQIAGDGEEAIDYLGGRGEFADRSRFPLPVLVLLDLKLPRVGGLEVLKWIRDQAELETTVVIMLTSSQKRSDIQQAYALGANSYLVKPSSVLELERIVGLVERYWLRLNQPTATMAAAALATATT